MICKPYVRHRKQRDIKFHAGCASYTPPQIARLLGIPTSATGVGKKVAVIELGGDFSQKDLDGYFKSLGVSVKPVVRHSVQGAVGVSDGASGADGEVMLDLCVVGGMAPGAELHCYFAPNTDGGFLQAIQQARADGMNAISISWGAPEDAWSKTVMAQFDAEFAACAKVGITVTVAAGDNGSSDGERGNHVDFPASSPNALACGGTSLSSLSPRTETVWNDGTAGGATGGGVSSFFALPAYQTKSGVPGGRYRGVPDVAAVADPETGWSIVIDGSPYVIGGTSAVAPAMAALAVCLSQALGKDVGALHATLYASSLCYEISQGNNGTYVAKVGWDACAGQGVPLYDRVLAALRPVPVPQPSPPPPAPAPTPVSKTEVVTITGTDFQVKVA
jgi:kumamolisin